MSNEIRYFVYCPRGFANERILMASDDEKVIQEMHRVLDDGMELTFEEIEEKEARELVNKNKVDVDTKTAVYSIDRNISLKPKWDELQFLLVLNSKLEYGSK